MKLPDEGHTGNRLCLKKNIRRIPAVIKDHNNMFLSVKIK